MQPLTKLISDLVNYGMERFGKYYSSYRGFVFDRVDPEGYGRLQLFVPHVYGQEPYRYWAWQIGQYSGTNYGLKCIPQIGDMVFVEFEGGDPRKPLWKYGHFGKDLSNNNEIPDTLKDPDIYWFRTPGGLGIEFNDKTKETKLYTGNMMYKALDATINVNGNKIQVTDSGVNIELTDSSKVYLGGKYPVLYSKTPFAEEITDLKEIGVAKKVKVG